jgi:hypothetical protein
LRNLKPWKPGQCPNPEGVNRKRRPFSDRYAEMSEARAPIELIEKINKHFGKPILPQDATWATLVTARAYLQVYLRGDVNMLREIADRVEGKAPQRLDLMVPAHTEVTFKVVTEQQPPRRERMESVIFGSIVALIKESSEAEDEIFLTKAAELAQMIQARAKQKGKPIDVPAR